MTMYVYQIKVEHDGENWDTAINSNHIEVVAEINGADNAECDRKYADSNFTDTDYFGTCFESGEGLPKAAEVEQI